MVYLSLFDLGTAISIHIYLNTIRSIYIQKFKWFTLYNIYIHNIYIYHKIRYVPVTKALIALVP